MDGGEKNIRDKNREVMKTLPRRICNLCLKPSHWWEQAVIFQSSHHGWRRIMADSIGDSINDSITETITGAILEAFTGSLDGGTEPTT
ncbi:hypothetical protein GOAMI_62_00080 [Gordonia amicalis NBRC 100051 = JCM 11271]|nr:hypothetical protein GOAMI_62_00080 [Gordonia amicalis NBRC 100051 = JCM 11271]